MNTLLKALFYTALAAAAWRIAQAFNARVSMVDASKGKEAVDAGHKYRRAIQRWENEGGKAFNRRRGGNRKRERRESVERQPLDVKA